MKRMLHIIGLMLCLLFSAQAIAQQANSINAIDVVSLQGGEVLVKIALKTGLTAPPPSFAINNPARIAFDLQSTANALGKNLVEVDKSDLRSVNVVQAGERTRIVLNLLRPVTYDSKIDGQNLLITLRPTLASAPTTGTSAAAQFVAPKVGDQKHNIRDIDFHRGKSGEARIEVNLSDSSTGIDIRQEGSNIVVEFIKTKLPRFLERRLDVVDFGTPVNLIDTYAQGDNVKMVIEPKGQFEQSAYQTDEKFILEVRPISADPNKLVQGSKPGYSGEKLSLDFRNTDIRSLLFAIADFTGLNIVISDSVSGSLTLRLKDVPWDQALDIILEHKGLGMRKNGNVVMIAPKEEIAAREKLDLEGRQQISELEQTRTESIQLNYQKAADVQKILSDEKQKVLSKRGSVVVDPMTNTLFVQDTPTKLDEIRKLIQLIDTPQKQVMIEARIVDANDNFSRDLGVRLGYTGPGATASPQNRAIDLVGGLATGTNTNLAAPTPMGTFNFLLFNSSATKILNLELTAAETDGINKTISSPRVVTANNVEATIEDGVEIPYTTGATATTPGTVAFKKAVLSLKVKPQITPDDNISMNLSVNQDTVGTLYAGVPSVNTKKITTQVLVDNGGTVVVGGIHSLTDGNTIRKVPVLGDIPVVGNLFKGTSKVNNKRELLIFVTPKVLKDSLNIR